MSVGSERCVSDQKKEKVEDEPVLKVVSKIFTKTLHPAVFIRCILQKKKKLPFPLQIAVKHK